MFVEKTDFFFLGNVFLSWKKLLQEKLSGKRNWFSGEQCILSLETSVEKNYYTQLRGLDIKNEKSCIEEN